MIIRADVESLLRKLLGSLPLKSDTDPAPSVRELALPGDGRITWRNVRVEPVLGADIEPLMDELRGWTVAMAWSSRPSKAVLDYILLAVEGRLDETPATQLTPERRQAVLDDCRAEAWRIIMDIRRAA